MIHGGPSGVDSMVAPWHSIPCCERVTCRNGYRRSRYQAFTPKIKMTMGLGGCTDSGPWLCLGLQCRARAALSCLDLSRDGACSSHFEQISPILGPEAFVWQHCAHACGMCEDQCVGFDHEVHARARWAWSKEPWAEAQSQRLLLEAPPSQAAGRSATSSTVGGVQTTAPVRLVGPNTFEVQPGRVALVLSGTQWLPPPQCDGSEWKPMHSHDGLRHHATASGCTYSWEQSAAMLESFMHEHAATVGAAFGVQTDGCFAVRQAYLTETNAGHDKDDVHHDICENHARLAIRHGADPMITRIGLTVLGYPHTRWHTTWGGATEFVPGACAEMDESIAVGSSTFADWNARRAIMKVEPLPHRTLVFRADLLHRATRPRGVKIGVATDTMRPGNRWATVIRMLCVASDAH